MLSFWEKPSSNVVLKQASVKTDQADHSTQKCDEHESSSNTQLGKRMEPIRSAASSYQGLDVNMPKRALLILPNKKEGLSSYTQIRHYPQYRRIASAEDIASPVPFADKWITPDMKLRKR